MDAERVFTLAEARAMLPRVEALLAEVQATRAAIGEQQALIQAVRRSATGDGSAVQNGTGALERRLREMARQLRASVEAITELGVQIKDLDRGLVDWVAEREGRRVYICWQRGEPEIGWWHELDAGFAGRQPIVPDEWE